MAKLALVKGTTSYRAYLFILDSSVTTGAGKTGLAYNTAGLVAYYVRPGASATAITLATQTATGAYSSGGFVEVDATNMPGVYRLDVPDAALATGVNAVVVMLKGASNMAPVVMEIELTGVDNQDAVHFGLSALPNAAAAASGGLPTFGTGTGQLNVSGGRADANVLRWNGTAVPAEHTAGYPIVTVKDGTGTGEIDTTSGKVDVNDKTGFSLSTAGIQAIWDALTSALTTVGSIGKRLADDIDAAISSRSTYAGGDTSGTTTLLSRLTSTRAGLLDNLDATISSRLATSGYTAPDNATISAIAGYVDTEVAAIKAKTDNLPAAPAAVSDIPTANANADALLDRANAVETGLTLRQALRLALAALAGKVSGAATTTVTIRNAVADSKNRIVATVDADGNRSAVTTDLS